MLDFEEELNELRNEFLEDMDNRLISLNGKIVEIEKGDHDEGLFKDLFRSLHNIKGTASTLGFTEISTVAHRLEDFISEGFSKKGAFTKQFFLDVFQLLDMISVLKKGYIKGRSSLDLKQITEKMLITVKPFSVLVLLESKTIRSYLSTALKKENINAIFMSEAISAFNRLLLEPIDIFITSLENSVVDGLNLIRMLKANQKTEHIKSILLTTSLIQDKAPDLILNKKDNFADKIIAYMRTLM